ncbi:MULTISPECIES: helix-turn-helix domain-containing protein [unclassified Flavobacterium]|jgi:transcriptional regulator with XRE-family HTH domain|uniref:helix-turn-helix domain-containing protein n=2 Tax=Flavobacterium TaxID=237 RepID=UPI0025BF5022|nr:MULTISPECIES: helix-turn-helix transcriptional regulator [unclassified Flavobacterium]
MVNIEDFIKRLEIILDYYSLNASSFADKIGVQRSSLSHLLSGRNKPSLDFILKIIEVFPEVDLYWILNGKGNFPKSENKSDATIVTPTPTINNQTLENKIENQPDLFSEELPSKKNRAEENFANTIPNTQNSAIQKNSSEIDRIVIFYKNGTFKHYSPE